jgi:flagellar hook-associated protein 2
MSISSPGVGSGLDINSIVKQLVEVEKQPLKTLQTKAAKLETQLSAFATVKSQLASLGDAASDLLSTDTWGAKTFSSSNTSAAVGTASTSSIASSFSMSVTQLASSQSARTEPMNATDTMEAKGTLEISIGVWSSGVFTATSDAAEVEIDSTDTLTDVANKINYADAGVTAVVVTSGTQQRLLVRSSDTGEDYGFEIKAYDESSTEITDGTTGVGKFSYIADIAALKQTALTAAMESTDEVGEAGTLSISIGEWSSGAFMATSDAAEVEIDSTDTLSSVVTKINAADAGVTAEVVTSGTEQRLLIRSSVTGKEYGFEIKAYDNSDPPTEITNGTTGVGKFSYIAATTGTSGLTLTQAGQDAIESGLTQTQAGQDASISVEGITITSSSNTVSDAVPGVTLNLLSTTSSDVQIAVGNNTDIIKTKITAFQDAYNSLVSNLKTLTKYDATTKKAGDLQGDGTAVTLLSVLRSMITADGPAESSATFGYLSDVGLQVQESGLLTTNSSKLTTALNSLSDLKTFFYNYGGTTTTNGLARRFRDFAWDANGVQGTVSLKNDALSAAITRNESSQDKFNLRIVEVQKRLYKQYGGLDSRMGGLNGLSSFVSAQVAQWNKK